MVQREWTDLRLTDLIAGEMPALALVRYDILSQLPTTPHELKFPEGAWYTRGNRQQGKWHKSHRPSNRARLRFKVGRQYLYEDWDGMWYAWRPTRWVK